MNRKRYTDELIGFALRKAEFSTSIDEIFCRMGISEQTFYRWEKNFAGMSVSEIRRLKQLEDENWKLKQVAADLTLDKSMPHMCRAESGEALPAPERG